MVLNRVCLVLLCILLFADNVFAFSNCQTKYDGDKRSLPEFRGMCNLCHLSPSGGGPQNEFGRAFANAGFKITDELVAGFPQFFQKPKPEITAPIIRKIKPKKVKINVQSTISIMGKNFVQDTKAFIDNNEVLTTFKTNMLLFANFVLSTAGIHKLKVKNPDEQESNIVKINVK